MSNEIVGGSFRDPDGFVFVDDGTVFRQVNESYGITYQNFMNSGLYTELVRRSLLVPHTEDDLGKALSDAAYKVLLPQQVPFISYPYEWSFSQLKSAALHTLEIQSLALDFGMSLKDASAYNIQFVNGRPILIDTLSFEQYVEGMPWVAYRQFCQHFLAPLCLMSLTDVRLCQLSRIHIDGIPLDLASRLLPWFSWFRPWLLFHVHLHARSQKRYADEVVGHENLKAKFGLKSLRGLVDSLRSLVQKLEWKAKDSVWDEYYEEDSYAKSALEHKKGVVERFLCDTSGETVWDLGANTGLFSRIAAEKGLQVISWDFDYACVDINYRRIVQDGHQNILPLVLDLANPSPGLGWAHCERHSLLDRAPVDIVLALALIHHLVISNNVPLERVAELFSRLCTSLIIEFVPKQDPKVVKLLANRRDVFLDYDREGFERAFGLFFEVKQSIPVEESQRILYLMIRK